LDLTEKLTVNAKEKTPKIGRDTAQFQAGGQGTEEEWPLFSQV
jgi:hypothetical protein